MNKTQLLTALHSERTQWDSILAQVGEERMNISGVTGDWSINDIQIWLRSFT